MIDSVKAIDDKTVEIKLLYPYAAIAHTFLALKYPVNEKLLKPEINLAPFPIKQELARTI